MSGLEGLSNQARLLSVWGVLPSYFLSSAILNLSCRKYSAGEQRHAAIHPQHLAIDEAGRVGGQEGNGIGDLRRLGITLQRHAFHLAGIGLAGGEKTRRGGGTGAHGIDAHTV